MPVMIAEAAPMPTLAPTEPPRKYSFLAHVRLPLAILYHVADHAEDEGGQWRLCNAAHKRGAKAERKAERACQKDQLREGAEHTAEQDGAALAEHTAHEWAQHDDHHNGYGLDR